MLQIEEGKYYRARNGKKIGPMSRIHGADRFKWGWCDEDNQPYSCTDDGRYYGGLLSHLDLIAEWVDEAPAVDLTDITTPFGLLDAETQKALRAHPGPIQNFSTTWVDCPDPQWFSGDTYRAKLTQRKVWINEYPSGRLGTRHYQSKDEADGANPSIPTRTICFREVL